MAQIQIGKKSEWEQLNPTLPKGVIGIELDSRMFKIGDGKTKWRDLPYGAEGPRGLPGKDGRDGKTPIKGVDYFDGEPGRDGKTPVKGRDYFDGEPGRDGKTPIKGVDYFDGKDGNVILHGEPHPKESQGEDGDLYLQDRTGDLFAKERGTWRKIWNLTGRPGRDGKDGSRGERGERGMQGDQGPRGPNKVLTTTDTTITGLLKGDGTHVAAAVAGVDYALPGGTGAASGCDLLEDGDTVAHGLGAVPSRVVVSDAEGLVQFIAAPKALWTDTTFTVYIKTNTGYSGEEQYVSWEAYP
jgi:hypothetical protein